MDPGSSLFKRTSHVAVIESDDLVTRSSLLGRLRDLEDNASWRVFFDTYWRLIYNVARKSGLSEDAAQEVVQETVIAVARKMPEFRYEAAKGSFKQWLLVVTRRRICDYLRRFYRSGGVAGFADTKTAARKTTHSDTAPSPDALIDAAWEQEWRENIFHAALARVRQRVNAKQFQVFDCCVLQNLPPRQVAQMLGLNAAQVYLAKHRVSAAVKRAAAEVEAENSNAGRV
jgi:RNA polymerase sigma factor (sigma-70 family)